MSADRMYKVRCDVPACYGETVQFGNSANAARRQARREDWTYVRGRDLCPDHRAGSFDPRPAVLGPVDQPDEEDQRWA